MVFFIFSSLRLSRHRRWATVPGNVALWLVLGSVLLHTALLGGGQVRGQAKAPPAETPVRSSALKLPDGTVVLVTRGEGDPDPAIERVLLTPQEYKALLEKVEEARKVKDPARPVSPSGCAIRGKVEMRGERLVAVLNVTFQFRTIAPRTLVALGCQRAAVVGAKSGSGKLPILNNPGEEGLTLLADVAGEQTVTLDLEVPITSRGTKGELGFDFSLPRAAVTTIALEQPPAKVKSLVIGTRTAEVGAMLRPVEIKRTNHVVEQVVGKSLPLGATDILEVRWDPPTTTSNSADPGAAVETDVVVRIDETQVETLAKLRLRGAARDWNLTLPFGADVSVERVGGGVAGTAADPAPAGMSAVVTRPTDPNKPVWLIRLPAEFVAAEWTVTVSVRQSRPKINDPKFRGPYAIGPFSLPPSVRHQARIRVSGSVGVRLGFKPAAEFRRQDLPAGADEDLVAIFTATSVPSTPTGNNKPPAWIETDARPAVAVARVRPTHNWKLTTGGWRLESTIRVTPPPRGEVEKLEVEIPAGWQQVEAGPDDLVEEVETKQSPTTQTLTLHLKSAVRSPVDITFAATAPYAAGTRDASFALPRFFQAEERDAKLLVSVPDGLEVRAAATAWNASPNVPADPLRPATPGKNSLRAVTVVVGDFDRGVGRVDISWQPYRPELTCEVRAEAIIQERQVMISQIYKFRTAAEAPAVIRLRGPGQIGLQSTPSLDPVGIGGELWEFHPPADAREFTLTVNYAVRWPRKVEGATATSVPIQLMWPESATRVETVLRIWGGGPSRAESFEGAWRELPNEPAPERDALPWFTLTASGISVPLKLEVPEGSVQSAVQVERGLIQAVVGDDGSSFVRARFLIRRSPATGVDLELPATSSLASNLEILVDGRRVDPQVMTGHADGSPRTVRVPVPEPRAGKVGAVLDVRCKTTAPRDRGRRALTPPSFILAHYRTPIRWHLSTPANVTPLYMNDNWQSDLRWVWRGVSFAPTAALAPDELDRWFTEGAENDSADLDIWSVTPGETFSARQPVVGPLEVIFLPRIGWVGGCAALVLVLGYIVSRLRPWLFGPVLGIVGVVFALLAVRYPNLSAQTMAAAQPGLFALLLLLGGQAAWRWYARRRIERLPGFSRLVPNGTLSSALVVVPGTGSRPNRGPTTTSGAEEGGSGVPTGVVK